MSSSENEAQLQITADFLEKIFEKPVKSFLVKPGSNLGENYLSILHAVHVSFNDKNEEDMTILIKSYPSHPARQYFLSESSLFEREYFMYNEMFPELEALAGDNDKLRISVAPFHGGNILGQTTKFSGTPWANDIFIIMTDLRVKHGYRNTDRQKGLDFDHASIAVEKLATLHATSWTLKQKSNLKLLTAKYPLLQDYAFCDAATAEKRGPMIAPLILGAGQAVLGIIKGALGDSHPATKGLNRFLSEDTMKMYQYCLNKNGANDEVLEALLRTKPVDDGTALPEPWMVVSHGDCWSNNFMFKYEDPSDPNKPTDAKMVDMQMSREGCPTMDLSYLLVASIRTKIRKGCEKELLEIYFKTFCRVCSMTSTDLMPGFTLESLMRRYRRAKIFGLLQAIPALVYFLLPPESAQNLDDGKNKDTEETLCDVMQGTFDKGIKNTILRDELVDLILNMYEDGVL